MVGFAQYIPSSNAGLGPSPQHWMDASSCAALARLVGDRQIVAGGSMWGKMYKTARLGISEAVHQLENDTPGVRRPKWNTY